MTCFINNKFEEGKATEFSSINPSNQESIWKGKAADKEQVQRALDSANTAFKAWSKLSLEQRLAYLEKYNEILTSKQEELAQLISQEIGKNIEDARFEAKIMVGKFKTAVSAYKDRTGIQEKEIGALTSLTKHKPLGVCVVFGPYNFPGHVANGHIIPALIAGNTIVFKPSNFCPKFSDEWMKIFQEAGFPDGVINMVQGEVETGQYLSQSDNFKGLFFTGSSRVGEILHKNLAGKLDKVLALELGGNNAYVVDAGFDLEKACELVISSAFIASGQRCTCARRLIIIDKDGYYDALINKLIETTKAMELKRPEQATKPGDLTCLITKEQAKLVLDKQAEYLSKGAKAFLEAKESDLGPAFISPSIIEINDYDKDEEVFGPLLKVYRAKDLNHAIEIANDTCYGLTASIATSNKEVFEKFHTEINTGLINWNAPTTGAMGIAPFGGTGISGNHRPSGYYAADYCAYPVASVLNEA